MKKTIKNIGIILLLPVIVIALWQVAANLKWISIYLIPSPKMIVTEAVKLVFSGRLWRNIRVSFARVLLGFLIGGSSGLLLGIFMGLYKTLNKLLTLFVSVLRPIPTIALIPVFILLLGIGEQSKYAIIAVGSFWSILLNTINGVDSTDQRLLQVAYAYKIPKYIQVFEIILPSALPSILTGVRLGMGAAWTSVIAAEMLAASKGIGYMINYARDNSQVSTMYVGVLTIGLIGLAIDRILILIQRYYLKKSRGIQED